VKASGVGWLLAGSPILLLVLIAMIALVAGASPRLIWSELGREETRAAIGLSLRTTLISTGLIVVFGSCLAVALARARGFFVAALELCVTIPAILPPSVAGIALLLAFGRQGLVPTSLAFTSGAVILAQVFVAAPFYIREAATALRSLDRDLLDAARMDGANGRQVGWRVALPLVTPFLISGAILAWARALGEFGATILFAGNLPGRTQTMPLAIYLGFESDLEEARVLSVLLLLIALSVLVITRLLLRRQMVFAH